MFRRKSSWPPPADLGKLEYVKILGGEPFITPNFIRFLDYLSERSDPKNIILEIATNGTSLPSRDVLERMNRFKMNYINVSLDSYARSNDYQRWGGSHEVTFKNAQEYGKIFDNVYVTFHSTVSVLTANDLSTTINIIRDTHGYHVSIDFVRDPEYLSMLNAPRSYVEWVLDKNRQNFTAYRLIETFTKKSAFNESIWTEMLDNIEKLDGYYGTKLEDYNPDLASYLESHGYRTTSKVDR